jgi:hypothetical protein
LDAKKLEKFNISDILSKEFDLNKQVTDNLEVVDEEEICLLCSA